MNAAIAAGKDVWRSHTEVMQWLSEVPPIIDKDIALLDAELIKFRKEGGYIEYNDAIRTWKCEYKNITIRIEFDEKGKIKYRAIEDTNLGKTPKDVIKKIGLIVSAHHELDKRIFAKKILGQLIEYLDNHATKESIDNMLTVFKDNGEVLFRAINGEESIFNIDLKEFVEEMTT